MEAQVPDEVLNMTTPSPCFTDIYDSSNPWSVKKYYKLCTNTCSMLENSELGDCCYWIVYHDRTKTNSETNQQSYQVNVVAVIAEGEDCDERTKSEIIHAFHVCLFKSKPIGFFQYEITIEVSEDVYIPSFITASKPIFFYSTGGCFQKDINGDVVFDENGDPVPCDEFDYCCYRSKQVSISNHSITSIDSNDIISVSRIYYGLTRYCPSSCSEFCENVIYENITEVEEPNPAFLCDVACNSESFMLSNSFDMELPFCPGCSVTVHYRQRITSACPEYDLESANDLYLDKIDFEDGMCPPCNSSPHQIHKAVVDNLLKYHFPNIPEQNKCEDYYRIFQSSCWYDYTIPGYELNDMYIVPVRTFRKCPSENCCIHRYRLCRDGGTNITYELLETISTEIDCEPTIMSTCWFICNSPE
jgi:hypothetical protein